MNPPEQRRGDIDGLRAVAILAVILYHAGFGLSRGFFIGVDMFFVISGYFAAQGILRDAERGTFSVAGFYLRRFRRLIPPLAVVALCCVIPAYLLASPQDFVRFGKTLLSVLAFVSNYFFYSQGGYFDAPLETNPFLPTWFLSVQAQFLIVFPLFFAPLLRRFPAKITHITAAIAGASFILSEFAVRHFPAAAYFLLFSRLWEIMIGVLAAVWLHNGEGEGREPLRPSVPFSPAAAEALTWGAVLAIAIAGLTYNTATPFPGLAALPVCLAAAVLVSAPRRARNVPTVNRLLALRPVAFMGVISYSVYLWHWPIFVYLKEYRLVETLSRQDKLAAILLSLAAGFVTWALVERRTGRPRPLMLFAPAALAAVFLAVLCATGGLPGRFPSGARPYIAALDELEESAAEGAAVQINDMTRESAERIRRGELHVFGDADADRTTFLIWGDSHSYHYRPLFEKVLAPPFPVKGLFLPTLGSPPLVGVYRKDRDTAEQQAAFGEITSAALDLVRERKIPVVLLSCNWHSYAENDLAANRDDGGIATGYEALAIGIEKTVQALDDAGCEIWIVRSSPSYPFAVPQTMMRRLRAGEGTDGMALSIAEHEAANAGVTAILASVAERHPGVRFVDPAPPLCPGGVCPPEIGDAVVYVDDNHLSAFGAMLAESAFAEFVESLRTRAEYRQ